MIDVVACDLKKGITEPISVVRRPHSLGLGFNPFLLGLPNTKSSSSKNVSTLTDEKASENTQPETKKIEPNIDDSNMVVTTSLIQMKYQYRMNTSLELHLVPQPV